MKRLVFILFMISPSLSVSQTEDAWIDKWQRSTISIGKIDTLRSDNNKIPYYKVIGTGVIFYVRIDTIAIPCLVTAKHVFHDSSISWDPNQIRIRFSSFDEKSVLDYFGIEIALKENNKPIWFSHPNKDVDLVCLPLNISSNQFSDPVNVLPYNIIASNIDIYEGAQILVFGYPGVIGKEFHSKALVRSGIIAWVPAVKKYDSKFLIDCDIYPGNSGGPVFKIPLGITREGKLESGGSLKFIGIVSKMGISMNEVQLLQNKGRQVPLIDQLGNKILSYESIGIGVIESAEYVKELLNLVQREINK